MHYIVTFHRPLKPAKVATEKFKTLEAARRWQKLVKDNGFTVRSVEAAPGDIDEKK